MSYRKPAEKEQRQKIHRDIGWWTDDQGYKHYGVIPINENERYERTRIRTDDSWLDQGLL